VAKFCGKCGSPLNDTAVFCGGCGAAIPSAAPAAAPAQSAPPFTPTPAYNPVPAYVPGPVALVPPAKKSNTLLKVIVAGVVLLLVGSALAIGGLWYAAQKVKEKARAAAAQSPGLSSVLGSLGGLSSSAAGGAGNSDDSSSEFKGDPCRFLSTQEVSQAIGVTIIRAEGEDNHCTYIARGDMADMKAKHMSSMVGGMGMDAKTQKTVQSITGSFFSAVRPPDQGGGSAEEVPVMEIDLEGHAQLAMKANRTAFKYVGGGGGSATSSGSGDLDGIGDEASVEGGGMLMVRKGDTLARFMYTVCPCGTDAIKPLAKLVASRL
jgi:hypothetical protein